MTLTKLDLSTDLVTLRLYGSNSISNYHRQPEGVKNLQNYFLQLTQEDFQASWSGVLVSHWHV